VAAGLPGFGLGGLFFIISALIAPIAELRRTVRGRSSIAAWRIVARQFAQAVTMLAAVYVTLRVFKQEPGSGLPLAAIGLTTAVLVTVLLGAKLLAFAAAYSARAQLDDGFVADHVAVGAFADPAFVEQEVGVPDHL
jgi:hypothetical protein